jgi:nitrite reductase (NO-forming)
MGRPASLQIVADGSDASSTNIAMGYATETGWLVAAGGVLFEVAVGVLAWLVARARRIGLNRRHLLPFAMYGAAIVAALAGGTLGAVVGGGIVDDPQTWLELRRAHLTLNLLGWASLTIAGTLVTFLPTVLRIRMPVWHGAASGALLVTGVAAIALGLGIGGRPMAVTGGVVYAAGALGLAWMAVKAFRMPRSWPVPVAAKHLVCALAWFVIGALVLPWMLAEDLAGSREPFVAIFVYGWVLQTLLGAWQYLLPMARPGHPDERRSWLAAIETGGTVQVLTLNVGVALLALRGADALPGFAGRAGTILALVGGAMALAKAWAFPVLGRSPALTSRHRGTWGA